MILREKQTGDGIRIIIAQAHGRNESGCGAKLRATRFGDVWRVKPDGAYKDWAAACAVERQFNRGV